MTLEVSFSFFLLDRLKYDISTVNLQFNGQYAEPQVTQTFTFTLSQLKSNQCILESKQKFALHLKKLLYGVPEF